jgi:two-component system sensor histidine kinase KdpD
MNPLKKHQAIIIRLGQILVFSAAIFCTTLFTLKFHTISSVSTVAFIFLIIVLLSAYFGTFLVAIITSVSATLCFDYFYLSPFGTFTIAAFPDWISLVAFLLTSVIISRLTASAAENKAEATMLGNSLLQLKEFGTWLLSIPGDQLTLTKIAGEAIRIFSLEYCSIHVYGEEKWHHFTGAASCDISRKVESQIDFYQDHNADLTELVDENILGVQYMDINKGAEPQAVLVVKNKTLSTEAIGALASMLGIHIMEIMKYKNSLPQSAAQ